MPKKEVTPKGSVLEIPEPLVVVHSVVRFALDKDSQYAKHSIGWVLTTTKKDGKPEIQIYEYTVSILAIHVGMKLESLPESTGYVTHGTVPILTMMTKDAFLMARTDTSNLPALFTKVINGRTFLTQCELKHMKYVADYDQLIKNNLSVMSEFNP